jgi:acyl dehydratase
MAECISLGLKRLELTIEDIGDHAMSETHTKLTDEMIEQFRSRIGVKSTGLRNPWHTEANKDALKHFAWGIGDPNPLWVDEGYAVSTPVGGIIAPPTWLYSCRFGPLGPGSAPSKNTSLPGIHGLYVGDSWEFFDHVRLGDRITIETYLDGVEELESGYSGRTIRRTNATRFLRQDGTPLAIARSEIRSHERGTPKKFGKYDGIEAWVYSEEELRQIAAQYAAEQPRGSAPIDWRTVVPGTEIPTRLKGPLTITSLITFMMGWGSPFCMTDRIAHEYLRLHPKANVPNRDTHVPDFPERAHWEESLWKEIGFPLGYDMGPQRISWFAHLLTDWIGDGGRIEKLKIDLREPNWLGDITWCRGRIEDVQVKDGQPRVKLKLWGENQRGRTHCRGEAQVILGNATHVE